ncbi:formylglycine-generating enzyme family protein [Sulfitobacter sp. CS16]|jgi:formylglycine-generating enzyme required for sulfatase activity|uniref:formylglycine-generating enzyme family protein n=1 Tax=Sulfitobacter sp. CS16 TaxID=3368573 RepID=UPI00374734D0
MAGACCAPRIASQPATAVQAKAIRATGEDLAYAQAHLLALPGGSFVMGAEDADGNPEDGEGPRRSVTLSPFALSRFTVTNRDFARFVAATGHVTTAERLGQSHVFHLFLSPARKRQAQAVPADTPWWYPTEGAFWACPEGPGSDIAGRENHPVVHVSWQDAMAYARWTGGTLPSEAQWEFAARAGSEDRFPWGSDLEPGGKHVCNVWQGRFPGKNTGADGFVGTAPVDAYTPNAFGLYNMIGNVWEWCADSFTPDYHRITAQTDPRHEDEGDLRSARGGSFLCHRSYCNRYRLGARTGNRADTTCSNLGFRIAAPRL